MTIRPIQISDAAGFQRICTQDAVLTNMLFLPSLRIDVMENRIRNLGTNQYEFVAEIEGKVVGFVGLVQGQNARRSHTGDLYLGVDSDHHRQGIGLALMSKILELADDWLMLERVELGVLATNPGAKALYEKLGFTVEGVKKGSIKSLGRFVDEIAMCRLRPNGQIVTQQEIGVTNGG
ncbi:GNAT family N-acetyltransferase [Paenibacillus sp. KN14-4R]|uniref:GNAT family N-acetyltransferase n=1 Tax=Paenibacillus sp. KN14-4R TaxID=3445773 RepID=UPI003FA06061